MAGSWSKCGMCGEEFNGLSNFDLHITEDYSLGNRSKNFISCRPPAEVGLRKTEEGYWGNPDKSVVMTAVRPAHGTILECAKCGTLWERPKQKGRLPKMCDDCRREEAK